MILPGKAIFSPPKPKPQLPPEPDPVPQPEDPEVKAQGKKNEQAAMKRRGISQTIKTSGVGDTSAPTTQRKTLLG